MFGTRAHETHLTAQHVEQLRQLVNTHATDRKQMELVVDRSRYVLECQGHAERQSALRFVIGWILGVVLMCFAAAPAWCAIAADVIVSTSQPTSASSITSPSFSTASDSELLLAFVAADGTSPGRTVTSMSGAGLTWELVRRTNVQLGTAEIWRAFARTQLFGVTIHATLSQNVGASITVVTLTGADASGVNGAGAIGATGSANANPGAPSASLVTTRDNSWVFGVGNDWDNALLRTVPSDQTIVSQYLARSRDTWWVQWPFQYRF